MMFSPRSYSHVEYVPQKSSPLSPRHFNALPRTFPLSPPMSPPQFEASGGKVPFSKRQIKLNPLLQNKDQGLERRRNLFLKKVREDSQEQRWKSRGGDDEIMRSIYVSEQKRWQATQARIAKEIPFSPEEEEDLSQQGSATHEDSEMMDDPLKAENAELEALVSQLEELHPIDQGEYQLPQLQENRGESGVASHYGSDDEDYDQLFMELINQERIDHLQGSVGADQEMMDTSS